MIALGSACKACCFLNDWLRKQQALHADPKAIQQINFTANLGTSGRTRIYFILEEVNETIFEFLQGTGKIL